MEEKIYNCMVMYTFHGDKRTEKLEKLKEIIGTSFEDLPDQSTFASESAVDLETIFSSLSQFPFTDNKDFITVSYPCNDVFALKTFGNREKIDENAIQKKILKLMGLNS